MRPICATLQHKRWLALCCWLSAPWALAQPSGPGASLAQATALQTVPSPHQGGTLTAAVQAGERLSDWLLRLQGPQANGGPVHWRVEAERLSQNQLRRAVLHNLETLSGLRHADKPGHGNVYGLMDWLQTLPLTGRLPLASEDPRALQNLPAQDPVLQDGHSVWAFGRPRFVAVVASSGQVCELVHQPGAFAADYLRACLADPATVSRVWLAQPSAVVSELAVAAWNEGPQQQPAPGAWLWAPADDSGILSATSSNLIRFLATQAPLEFLDTQHSISAPSPGGPVNLKPTLALTSLPKQVQVARHAEPRDAALTANDWGDLGLLQTPSARMGPAGSARFHISRVAPYTRATVMLQPLDWLEGGFRYTDVANRLYGPANFSGSQSYKDKSIDLKLRLRKETRFWPQVALGVRDLGGTGLFSSEYLVASKRWGDWDASLGLGWGNMAARANLRNPLASLLGNAWSERRQGGAAFGGTFNTDSYFKGRTALFGGVQYAPNQQWVFKAELDGNDYQSEPQGNNQTQKSRFNFGAVYRQNPYLDWTLGLERGNTVMLGMSLHAGPQGFASLAAPKVLDKPLPPIAWQAPDQASPGDGLAQDLLALTGWRLLDLHQQGNQASVALEVDAGSHVQTRVDTVVRLLHQHLPAEAVRFEINLQNRSLALAQVVVQRGEWVAERLSARPAAFAVPSQRLSPGRAASVGLPEPTRFQINPSYSQILGGPNAFLLYQIGLQANAEHRFSTGTWVAGQANLRLLDTYEKFVSDVRESALPKVRTDLRQYVTTSRLTLPNLQLTHVRPLGGGHYASAYAGLLEPMFAGVGGEWLYRPWQDRWALGLDLNHVRQRGFHQNFALRDYRTTTGHASLYWDTGLQGLNVKLSVGRYLAGDVGATLDVRREFENGVSIGAWATKTNVSAADFGEGSFDKGIYVRLPFDLLLPKTLSGNADLRWNPLTRDGGARLGRRHQLHDLTRLRDAAVWGLRPALVNPLRSGASLSQIEQQAGPHPLSDLDRTHRRLGHQLADIPASSWWMAGGAVLLSGLVDRKVDDWARGHSGGNWDRLGSVANAVPYLMAAGAGALYTGLAGPGAASTAETALRAGAYTVAANLGLRYVVGRARPQDGLGHAQFDGFNRGALKSGFASNHTAMAFALVTPFAQQTNNPWLYGLAAAAGFGRVQKREHWVSDAVGGALLGYTIGSLLSQQQLNPHSGGPRLGLGPRSVHAQWDF